MLSRSKRAIKRRLNQSSDSSLRSSGSDRPRPLQAKFRRIGNNTIEEAQNENSNYNDTVMKEDESMNSDSDESENSLKMLNNQSAPLVQA